MEFWLKSQKCQFPTKNWKYQEMKIEIEIFTWLIEVLNELTIVQTDIVTQINKDT